MKACGFPTGGSRIWYTNGEGMSLREQATRWQSLTAPTPRRRKATYIARKEEREKLLKELEELQIKLQKLQEAEIKHPSLLQQELQLSLLREAVKLQQLSLVNVQSAVSGYVSIQEDIPYKMTLCLGKDPSQRRKILLAAKQRKIHSGLAYITERTRYLDLFRPFSETSSFSLDDGDFIVFRLDRNLFDASRVSVRQLYDAIATYFSNIEMRITDLLGVITTRDEIEYGVDGIQQSRFESSMPCGIPFEMNTVSFQEFTDQSDKHGDGGPFGVFTADFVDEDNLYPYRPDRCVRHDITSIMTVRMHTRMQFNTITGHEEIENVVVWTRSFFGKQRHTETPLPPLAEHSLREQLGKWDGVMLSCVLEQIY